jgi:hypothetical protein
MSAPARIGRKLTRPNNEADVAGLFLVRGDVQQ